MSSPKNVAVLVYILIALFGVASWVDINGLWVELPILVQELPEGWSLPSYIVAITQVANLGPLLYSVICSGRLKERTAIFVIIGTGAGTCLMLIFFWKETVFIAGAQRSVPLFIMNFILACVDCTSTVIFYPFMATFKPAYMTAYFTGEGLGGLLPGLLGLIQGAGRVVCVNDTMYNNMTINGTFVTQVSSTIKATYGDNLFSFEVFFSIICIIIVVSGISFTILVFHPVLKREHSVEKVKEEEADEKYSKSEQSSSHLPNTSRTIETKTAKDPANDVSSAKDPANDVSSALTTMSRCQYVTSLLLTGWVNCLKNSVLLSVQSYSCLPYGTTQYHLAVTLANVANPLACFVNLFINVTSVPALFVMSVISSLLGAYIMVAAAMSPAPVLVGTLTGSILIVSVWVACVFLLTYVKVCLAALFRMEGKKSLLYCGVATQVGSAAGGATMFVLVNLLNLFRSADSCP